MSAELVFPPGFWWGAATSAYQVEGGVDADGRGESIWDRFCAVPGAVERGESGAVACDSYARWRSDVDLMAALGLTAYRFSIAWPRLFPDGDGRLNPRGLAHYDRLVDALLERGIAPLPTLYHWDLPQALQETGGWRNRDTAHRFAEYAARCFDAYADRVPRWVTVNEPWIAGLLGHQLGLHAPGEKDLRGSVTAMHHLLLGHGLAATELGDRGAAGVAFSLFPHVPDTDGAADRAAADGSDGYVNRWFLDPVLTGRYPDDMRAAWERAVGPLSFVADGDEALIGTAAGFVGVNFYTRRIVAAATGGDGPFDWQVRSGRPEVPRTDLGWEIVPEALTELLVRLHRDYPGVPLLITENGGVFDDVPGDDGAVHDRRRIEFLHRHLVAVHRAIEAGAPVLGYLHWSLLDNFEWAMGYRPRFGLVHVDFPSQRRTVKDSGHWYASVARCNAVPARLDLPAAPTPEPTSGAGATRAPVDG